MSTSPEPVTTGSPTPGRPRPVSRWAYRLWAIGRLVVATTVLVVLYFVAPLHPSDGVAVLLLALVVVGIGGLIAFQAHAIAGSPRPELRALEALATTIPLLLVGFASCYAIMSEATAGTFNEALDRTDALYFSVTVFATVGFGDIAAVSTPGRVVVTLQMVVDLLVLGVGLRVITGAVQRGRQRQGDRPTAGAVGGADPYET